MNQVIVESISEAFINYKDNIERDTVSYLSHLISESESMDELKEQVIIVIREFVDSEVDPAEADALVDRLVALLKKRGAIDLVSTPKAKSHLVCQVDPNAEPSLNDPELTFEQYLGLTRSKDAGTRRAVLRTMCPCKVKADVEQLWSRIMEMAHDEDPKVRYQVMHNLCDGSPSWREESVITTLESMHNDSDPKIRRRIHNILTHYKHTGKWNIM
eukprot:gene5294-6137_t